MTDTSPRAAQVGRLADPDSSLATDPRTHTGLLAGLAAFGLDAPAAPAPMGREAAPEAVAEFVGASHGAFEGLYAALQPEPSTLPVEVTHRTGTTTGPDGHEVVLHVFRPAGGETTLPCVVYVHGGGMTILDADNAVHQQWARDLAATGLVVVVPAFRNAWTPTGPNPFPAGLDDVGAALDWVHDHRTELGASRIVLQGESGGANLALAATIKAKREGRLDRIDGVYAMVPYISGGYGWSTERKLAELPSMVENDGYYINTSMMDLLVSVYDPTGDNAENPLAWPYFAAEEDLRGLPPHVVSANELDPLRDEGVAYARKLQRAGVSVVGRVNLGLTHAAEMSFREAATDAYRATVRDIHGFAASL